MKDLITEQRDHARTKSALAITALTLVFVVALLVANLMPASPWRAALVHGWPAYAAALVTLRGHPSALGLTFAVAIATLALSTAARLALAIPPPPYLLTVATLSVGAYVLLHAITQAPREHQALLDQVATDD